MGLRHMDKWEKLSFSIKIGYVAMVITLFWIASMITLTLYGFPITTPTKDVSNLSALVGGSAIALFISLTILMYSNAQEKESKKIVSDIKNIIIDQKSIMENQGRILEEQLRIRNEKREFAEQRCWFFLNWIKKEIIDLKSSIDKPDFIDRANQLKEMLVHLSQKLQKFKQEYSIDLSPTIISHIDLITEEIEEMSMALFLKDPDAYDDIIESVDTIYEEIIVNQKNSFQKSKEPI
jgi:hypothetical protein